MYGNTTGQPRPVSPMSNLLSSRAKEKQRPSLPSRFYDNSGRLSPINRYKDKEEPTRIATREKERDDKTATMSGAARGETLKLPNVKSSSRPASPMPFEQQDGPRNHTRWLEVDKSTGKPMHPPPSPRVNRNEYRDDGWNDNRNKRPNVTQDGSWRNNRCDPPDGVRKNTVNDTPDVIHVARPEKPINPANESPCLPHDSPSPAHLQVQLLLLQEQVRAITSERDTFKTEVTELKTVIEDAKFTVLQAEKDAFRAERDALDNRVILLQKKLDEANDAKLAAKEDALKANMESHRDTLRAQLLAFKTEFTTVKSQVGQFGGRIEALENQMRTSAARYREMQGRENGFESGLEEMRGKFAELESRLGRAERAMDEHDRGKEKEERRKR